MTKAIRLYLEAFSVRRNNAETETSPHYRCKGNNRGR
jgi:hypothetical protein